MMVAVAPRLEALSAAANAAPPPPTISRCRVGLIEAWADATVAGTEAGVVAAVVAAAVVDAIVGSLAAVADSWLQQPAGDDMIGSTQRRCARLVLQE